jgi:hypothetical protein
MKEPPMMNCIPQLINDPQSETVLQIHVYRVKNRPVIPLYKEDANISRRIINQTNMAAFGFLNICSPPGDIPCMGKA